MTLRTALDQGTDILNAGSVPVPRLTAEVLLAHALQRDRVYLYTHSKDELTELGWIHFGRYLHQRLKGVPTQYITGRQEFYGREFRVSRHVLIPRPETEGLVGEALAVIFPGARILDVGTGSGAIAVTLALESPQSRVFATDLSADALSVARSNGERLGASVAFVQCDLLEAFGAGSIDVVVSNPPYVGTSEAAGLQREVLEHEPHLALFAGEDGTEAYRRIVARAEQTLRPGGHLLLELGWRSLDRVRDLLGRSWSDVAAVPDLAGIARVLRARYAP
ncbi:MAG TPA: peptide chain release factor N(5)-glutamine methyltransferase [Bryobacteraceae bacterium]|nr:peptide chain release factor N(5)-glutamine methyltransferase [Bryobacteraceae bacterium]